MDVFHSIPFDTTIGLNNTNIPEQQQPDSSTGIPVTTKTLHTNGHDQKPQTSSEVTKKQSVARKTESEAQKEPQTSSHVTKKQLVAQETGTEAQISDKLPRWAIER